MKDQIIISAIRNLEKNMNKVAQNSQRGFRNISLNTLQLNTIVRMLKLIPPLYWLFKKYFKQEQDKYYSQMIKSRQMLGDANLEKQQKAVEMAKKKKEQKDGKIGRNQPCSCGSGIKYKKCCLNKEKIEENQKRGLQKS